MENEKADPKKAGFTKSKTTVGKSGRGDMSEATAGGKGFG
jgi:hypothetical protein